MMVWGSAIGALIVVGLAVMFAGRFGTDPTQVDSPLIGQPVPSVELVGLDRGEEVDLRSLAGKKVVVNFFASWCVPCREEHKALVAVQEKYAEDGVLVVGIVYQDDPEQVRGWLAELGSNYPAVLDPGSRAAIEFGVFGIPETFFIDEDGTIVAKIFGPADEASLSSILDPMIAGGTPESRTTGDVQSSPGG